MHAIVKRSNNRFALLILTTMTRHRRIHGNRSNAELILSYM